mmetsp:Transcript_1006/g.2183  ORF Transcript_1006/g.2183 Transcript_1006/m.2183 type:complete len:388 (-) Transcript_1006:374-1537(-)
MNTPSPQTTSALADRGIPTRDAHASEADALFAVATPRVIIALVMLLEIVAIPRALKQQPCVLQLRPCGGHRLPCQLPVMGSVGRGREVLQLLHGAVQQTEAPASGRVVPSLDVRLGIDRGDPFAHTVQKLLRQAEACTRRVAVALVAAHAVIDHSRELDRRTPTLLAGAHLVLGTRARRRADGIILLGHAQHALQRTHLPGQQLMPASFARQLHPAVGQQAHPSGGWVCLPSRRRNIALRPDRIENDGCDARIELCQRSLGVQDLPRQLHRRRPELARVLPLLPTLDSIGDATLRLEQAFDHLALEVAALQQLVRAEELLVVDITLEPILKPGAHLIDEDEWPGARPDARGTPSDHAGHVRSKVGRQCVVHPTFGHPPGDLFELLPL